MFGGSGGGAGGGSAASSDNPVQAKYFKPNTAGGFDAISPLSEFIESGAHDDPFASTIGTALYEGKADPAAIQLMKDLLQTEPDNAKTKFYYDSVLHAKATGSLEMGVITGLGLARQKDAWPVLANLIAGERVKTLGVGYRRSLIDATWFMNQQGEGIPAIVQMISVLGTNRSFPEMHARGLQVLMAWKSNAAVELCTQELGSDVNDEQHRACMQYLGAFNVKAAAPAIARFLEKHTTDVVHALGQIDDKESVKLLEDMLKTLPDTGADRPAVLAALINLGKDNYWAQMEAAITGKQNDRRYMQTAVMESVAIKAAKYNDKVQKALRAASKSKLDDGSETAIYVNAALAMRGDNAGIEALAAFLGSPKEDERNKAFELAGGTYEDFNKFYRARGAGIVTDARILAAIEKYRNAEPSKDKKAAALRLMAHLRSALDVKAASQSVTMRAR